MRSIWLFTITLMIAGCTPVGNRSSTNIIDMDGFALAARYGTPASYELRGEYMQLSYGSDAAGCRLIVLIDQDQHVTGWASVGKACTVR